LELFFKSNRPGGYGGLDLYVARRPTTSDPWGAPKNLGPLVNSPYDEAEPSLSPDGLWLLFNDGESPRPGGYGMLDLWMAKRTTLSAPWQMPVNLGPKVNSPANDFYPRISPDGRVLHFRRSMFGRGLENWQAPILPIPDRSGSEKVDGRDQTRPAEGSAGS
jgi:Tol biopolymer transport system component